MLAILEFLHFVISALLDVIFWLVIANAVVSWLVAFDILNLRNRAAYNAVRMLDRAVSPLLRPIRRFLPTLGGLDFSPVVLLILISAVQATLLPALFGWLERLAAGGGAV
jgi:YggT family protein